MTYNTSTVLLDLHGVGARGAVFSTSLIHDIIGGVSAPAVECNWGNGDTRKIGSQQQTFRADLQISHDGLLRCRPLLLRDPYERV